MLGAENSIFGAGTAKARSWLAGDALRCALAMAFSAFACAACSANFPRLHQQVMALLLRCDLEHFAVNLDLDAPPLLPSRRACQPPPAPTSGVTAKAMQRRRPCWSAQVPLMTMEPTPGSTTTFCVTAIVGARPVMTAVPIPGADVTEVDVVSLR